LPFETHFFRLKRAGLIYLFLKRFLGVKHAVECLPGGVIKGNCE